ncbi:hypothetical protein ACF3DV_15170 [Chlorogloeopsis fritschii PCC 9212]|nr:hypothetical protein [Chlorogloeopsis fritschii]
MRLVSTSLICRALSCRAQNASSTYSSSMKRSHSLHPARLTHFCHSY